MRKFLLFSMGLFMAGMLQAQIQKGDIQLGGSVNFSSQEFGGQDRTSFNFTPRAAFFLSDLTSLGFFTSFNTNTSTVVINNGADEIDLTNNQFRFGVSARFHKMVTENLYLFLQPSVSIGTGKRDNFNIGETDVSLFGVGLSPGITYFLTNKFALGMSFGGLGYNRIKEETDGTESIDKSLGLSMNLNSVGFSLSYFIRK